MLVKTKGVLQQRIIPSLNDEIKIQETAIDDLKRVQLYRMKILTQSNVRRKYLSKFGGESKVDKDVVLKDSFMGILLELAKRNDLTCNSKCPFICPKIDLEALGLDKVSVTGTEDEDSICQECGKKKVAEDKKKDICQDDTIAEAQEEDYCQVCRKKLVAENEEKNICVEEHRKESELLIESLKGVIKHLTDEEAIAGCPSVCKKICEKAIEIDPCAFGEVNYEEVICPKCKDPPEIFECPGEICPDRDTPAVPPCLPQLCSPPCPPPICTPKICPQPSTNTCPPAKQSKIFEYSNDICLDTAPMTPTLPPPCPPPTLPSPICIPEICQQPNPNICPPVSYEQRKPPCLQKSSSVPLHISESRESPTCPTVTFDPLSCSSLKPKSESPCSPSPKLLSLPLTSPKSPPCTPDRPLSPSKSQSLLKKLLAIPLPWKFECGQESKDLICSPKCKPPEVTSICRSSSCTRSEASSTCSQKCESSQIRPTFIPETEAPEVPQICCSGCGPPELPQICCSGCGPPEASTTNSLEYKPSELTPKCIPEREQLEKPQICCSGSDPPEASPTSSLECKPSELTLKFIPEREQPEVPQMCCSGCGSPEASPTNSLECKPSEVTPKSGMESKLPEVTPIYSPKNKLQEVPLVSIRKPKFKPLRERTLSKTSKMPSEFQMTDEPVYFKKLCRCSNDSVTVKTLRGSLNDSGPLKNDDMKMDGENLCIHTKEEHKTRLAHFKKKRDDSCEYTHGEKHLVDDEIEVRPPKSHNEIKCKPCRQAIENMNTMTEEINLQSKSTDMRGMHDSIPVTDMEPKQCEELTDLTIDEKGKVVVRPEIKLQKQLAGVLSVKDVIDKGEAEFKKIQKLKVTLKLPCSQSVPCATECSGYQKTSFVNFSKTISVPCAYICDQHKQEHNEPSFFSLNTCKGILTKKRSLYNYKLKDAFKVIKINHLTKQKKINLAGKFQDQQIMNQQQSLENQIEKDQSNEIFNLEMGEDEVGDVKKNYMERNNSAIHLVSASTGTVDLQYKAVATMVEEINQNSESEMGSSSAFLYASPANTRLTADSVVSQKQLVKLKSSFKTNSKIGVLLTLVSKKKSVQIETDTNFDECLRIARKSKSRDNVARQSTSKLEVHGHSIFTLKRSNYDEEKRNIYRN